jgi:hypothetical protein
MRARRVIARACLAGAAGFLALAAVIPTTQAQEADEPDAFARPEVWRGEAAASVVLYEADREGGVLPLPQVIHGELIEGRSAFDSSGNQIARASIFFPGQAVIAGPNLLCGTFGGEFPEELKPVIDACTGFTYPLSVQADNNFPDLSTGGGVRLGDPGQQLAGNGASARAQASDDGVRTDSVVGDLRIAPIPGGLPTSVLPIPGTSVDADAMRVDNATARTSHRFDNGAFVVDAEARLNGVHIGFGLINIDSIVSHTVSRAGGTDPPKTESSVVISGVTIAGQPATIGSEGIGGITKPVADALANLGITARVIGADSSSEGTTTRGSANGLLVRIDLDLSPVTVAGLGGRYYAIIQLANTGALASADGALAAEPDDSVDAPIDDGGAIPPFDSGESFVPFAPEPGPDLGPAPTFVPSDSGNGEQAAGGGTVTRPVSVIADNTADRLKLLYLSFTLAAIGVCLLMGLRLPPRLPGPRT